MRVAIEGCCHGELDDIYGTLASVDRREGQQTDLLLTCGDFQALRNHADLHCFAVPDKYKRLGGFSDYYSGKKTAPLLTIVIGGNHEASNYMWELFHGGWLAPRIYYLGAAGSLLINGLRISGISGIYKSHDYQSGRFETLPYDRSTVRSTYHTREYDVFRLGQLSLAPPDVFLSHDWPLGIAHHGDLAGLLRYKPYFRQEIESNTLGSPPLMHLLRVLKPPFWFAAHLHARFAALVKHDGSATQINRGSNQAQPAEADAPAGTDSINPDAITLDDSTDEAEADALVPRRGVDESIDNTVAVNSFDNPDAIALSDDEDTVAVEPPLLPLEAPLRAETIATRFLALSKCLPKQQFLHVMEMPSDPLEATGPTMTFDPYWLAITRALHPWLTLERRQKPLPYDPSIVKGLVEKEVQWVKDNLADGGKIPVESVQQFACTAPTAEGASDSSAHPQSFTNPQTEALMALLQLPNRINSKTSDS
ncbi:hypothetical protein E5Q_00050 [Mixia osmundae IAM 14324]|uniref:Lariat debranching enzyme C-terminal domain-containing protein n=1 Tax=Mixia osmundae (strain CBS 9802 / IAM 14324 / JCM 22182 / KY 12970) TaxID=764103 RepID=G7DS49_MIXOS|nr:hypothetical protein E5Q_00050 [Mixia osmundae IAM 14324]